MKTLSPSELNHERELFRAWGLRMNLYLGQTHDIYLDREVRCAWMAWRDRAALDISAPAKVQP